jgi:hypothetical protein
VGVGDRAHRRRDDPRAEEADGEYATVKLTEPVIGAVQTEVEAKIRAFGSAGTASR